ncbi:four helix bundle protein [Sediminibacterium ginsengisoli]|uniref:Four helix bundle protein n=1 Tax=Sediminibacterium ginsengisoli TaxID=413434 RepID=A0A1T4KRZ1_9BACT|nr:four helix bundle protein [Sediminibacterium ginsengisoli]SJZ45120.1 four helix bundle protein [Sediminibacterium ginsengisoli]
MESSLVHARMYIFGESKSFVVNCYRITKKLPADERFGLISQIRRAALSVHLNLAEGCARRSPKERARFFEISRSSLVEVDAALGIAEALEYITAAELEPLFRQRKNIFKSLSSLIRATTPTANPG